MWNPHVEDSFIDVFTGSWSFPFITLLSFSILVYLLLKAPGWIPERERILFRGLLYCLPYKKDGQFYWQNGYFTSGTTYSNDSNSGYFTTKIVKFTMIFGI